MSERLISFGYELLRGGSLALRGTVQDVDTLEWGELSAPEAHKIVGRIHTVRDSDQARHFAKERERGKIAILRVVDEPVPDAQILGSERRLIPLPPDVASDIVSVLGSVALSQQQ